MAYYLLGVEKSGSHFKIAAFEKSYNKYRLYAFGNVPINIDEDKTSEELKNWIASNLADAENITAVLAIPESSIFLKEITLPKISEQQIGEAARWELLNDTPVPLDSAIYDWKKLSQSPSSFDVLTFLVKEQISEIFVSIFEKAGVQLIAIEPSSYSFVRSVKEDFSKNTLLINTDNNEVDLLIMRSSAPVFTSSFKLQSDKQSKTGTKAKESEILSEAKKIIEFWEKKHEIKVEQVVVSQVLANGYQNLIKELEKTINIKVFVTKDRRIKKFSISGIEKSALPEFLTAIGAAARITGKEHLNLLPKDKKDALLTEAKIVNQIKNTSFFAVINLFLITVAVIVYAIFSFWNTSLANNIEQTKNHIKNHPAQSQLQYFKTLNQKVSAIEQLIEEQQNTGEKLSIISSMTPSSVKLTNIDFFNLEEETWKIRGEGDRKTILAYYEKLKTESNAKDVEMPYSNFSQKTGTFEIIVIW